MFLIYVIIAFISFFTLASRCQITDKEIWICALTLIVLSAIWPLTWLGIVVIGVDMVLERRDNK